MDGVEFVGDVMSTDPLPINGRVESSAASARFPFKRGRRSPIDKVHLDGTTAHHIRITLGL